MLGGRVNHGLPADAGLGAGNPTDGINRDRVHPVGADQQRIAQVTLRAGIVGAALHCHAQPGAAGIAHDLGYLGGRARIGNRCRILLDREVEAGPGALVLGVPGVMMAARAEASAAEGVGVS